MLEFHESWQRGAAEKAGGYAGAGAGGGGAVECDAVATGEGGERYESRGNHAVQNQLNETTR